MATIALLSRYGSKLAYDTGIGVNSIGFFSGKFLPWLDFMVMVYTHEVVGSERERKRKGGKKK